MNLVAKTRDTSSFVSAKGLAVLSLGLLVACSSSNSENDTADSGGATGNSGAAGTNGNHGGTGGTDSGSGTTGSSGADGGVISRTTEKVGEIGVQLIAPVLDQDGNVTTEGFSSILAKVYDAPVPARIILQEVDREGDCVLYTPKVPFCDPSCGSDVCVADDQCVANPTAHDLGTLTIDGLDNSTGESSFTIDPIGKTYVTPADVSLPFPPTGEGDPIQVSTSGGDLAPFVINGKGISPLEINGTPPYAFDADSPFDLAWEPPQAEGISRIHVKIDISHHGGTKGQIECDTADTGSLQVSQSLVSQLLALGVAGFPTVIVTRQNVTSIQIEPGRVDLNVYQYVEQGLAISGLTSCSDTSTCPEGQTCQADQTCK